MVDCFLYNLLPWFQTRQKRMFLNLDKPWSQQTWELKSLKAALLRQIVTILTFKLL